MFTIKIILVGRSKATWLEEGVLEYTKRLAPIAKISTLWAEDEEQLLKLARKEKKILALDPKGRELTSEAFADFLQTQLVEGGSRLTFILGGADGLPSALKESLKECLSLSKMTFTHQFARLILIEQLYRAFEILKGSPYHKS